MTSSTTAEHFDAMVARLSRRYPHQCHIEMNKHRFYDLAMWADVLECKWDHYTYRRNHKTCLAMCFVDPGVATLFALKWS